MNSDDKDRPEPREAHCQCCGGYAGMGRPDPEFCATCRNAGEHLDQDGETERDNLTYNEFLNQKLWLLIEQPDGYMAQLEELENRYFGTGGEQNE